MSIENYSRHAEIWGWFSGDRADEIDCWATLSKRYGATVLAAMVATGEVAAALAGRGFKVTAVDITKEMVVEGIRRHGGNQNLTFVEGDVRSLRLAEKEYDFAFIGTTDFHHLLTSSDRKAALMNLYTHTRSGGGLGLELWFPSCISWSTPWKVFEPLSAPADPTVKVWKKGQTEFNAESCMVTIAQEVFIERGGRTEHFPHTFPLQLFDKDSLAVMLHGAGYTIAKEYGSYGFDPWTPQSPKWIVEAVKE